MFLSIYPMSIVFYVVKSNYSCLKVAYQLIK